MAERLKSLTLVLLLITLVLLLSISLNMGAKGRLALPDPIMGLFVEAGGSSASPQLQAPQIAAWPLAMAAIGEDALYAPWTYEQYESFYQQTIGILEEALGSSGDGEEISKAAYLEYLRKPGLFFRYDGELPLYLFKAWADTESLQDDRPVQNVLLTAEGDKVLLVLSGGEGHTLYRTAAKGDDLLLLTGEITQTTAAFAFTLAEFSHLAADELVYLEGGTLPGYRMLKSAAGKQGLETEILEVFGLNPNLIGSYINAQGDTLYVEGAQILALRQDGRLEYTNTPEEDGSHSLAGTPSAGTAYCEAVRKIIHTVWQSWGGSGRLSLSLYRYDGESDTWYFGFDLLVGGRPVLLEDMAAYATVRGGVIQGISVTPWSVEAEGAAYVPWYLTAAVAEGRETRLLLCYQPDGTGGVTPVLCRPSRALAVRGKNAWTGNG